MIITKYEEHKHNYDVLHAFDCCVVCLVMFLVSRIQLSGFVSNEYKTVERDIWASEFDGVSHELTV